MEGPVPQIPASELHKALAGAPPPFLLDVRNPPELLVDGKIAGAVNIPLPELQQRAGEVPAGRPVVCVCKSGMRSTNAAGFLRQKGCDASSLLGGMNAWSAAALPVIR